MSEFLYYSGEFSELADIETKISELERLLGSGEVDSSVEDVYQSTLAGLRNRAAELACDSTVTGLVSEIAQKADASRNSLDEMERIVGNPDFLPQSYADRQEEVSKTLQNVAGFVERYPDAAKKIYPFAGSLTVKSAEVSVEDVQEPNLSSETTVEPADDLEELSTDETARKYDQPVSGEQVISPEIHMTTDVPITFGLNNVRIGKQGRIIPYSSRKYDDQYDYTELRRQALFFMIGRQGEQVTPHEMWSSITNGQEFDGHKMKMVRVWLQTLTYRRSPLIGHNALRGAGSRYWVQNRFNLSVNLDYDPSAQEDEVVIPSIDEEEPETIEKLTPFAVDYTDLYVAATLLKNFNDILEKSGCGIISEDMIVSLSDYAPDWSDACNNAEIIKQRRKETHLRVKAFLADEDRLFKFLDRVSPDSGKLAFVEFLSDLDDEQRNLIDRLFTAERESGLSTNPRGRIVKGESRVYDANDVEVRPLVRSEPEAPLSLEDLIATEQDLTDTSKLDLESEPHEVSDEEGSLSEAEVGQDSDKVDEIVSSILAEHSQVWFDAGMNTEDRCGRHQLSRLYNTHIFSAHNLKVVAKHLRHGDGKLTFKEAMTILMSRDPRIQNSRKTKKIVERQIRELSTEPVK